MPSTNLSTNTTRFLVLLTVLLIAASLNTSCSKDGGQGQSQNSRNNAVQQPSASPSPSPSPSPAPSLQPTGETIIVIKGGSVDLDFNETIYSSNGASNPTYICNTCAFKTLEVGPVGGPYTQCQIVNQNSTITIHAGGGTKNIKIKRNSQSKIQIEFNAKEYGPDTTGTKKHYNPNNNIQNVQVTPSLNCQCPSGQKCEIRVTTSY